MHVSVYRVWASGLRASVQYCGYQACGHQSVFENQLSAGIRDSVLGIEIQGYYSVVEDSVYSAY